MTEWKVKDLNIEVKLGPFDDSKLGLVVKSQRISLGLGPGGGLGGGSGPVGGFGITVQEASDAENVQHWPSVSIKDTNRRHIIYKSTKEALEAAEKEEVNSVGFYTLGLEVSHVPSWEVAEEITRAIAVHSNHAEHVKHIIVVASSAMQVSSFQYALDNVSIITS
ncbi:MAG: hypothetical protein ACFE7R_08390 [Candidatus Hodarchaeota archaeon]